MDEKPEISIILPAIRKHNWDKLYDSIVLSTSRKFELIICGPTSLTERLQNAVNVKYVKDFGSPTRASMIAASLAEGKLITWTSDDAVFLNGALDSLIDEFYEMTGERKVLISRYTEGALGVPRAMNFFLSDSYYKINGGIDIGRPCTYSKFLPDDWYIFNTAIMYKEYFEKLGGLDCEYEHAAMADTDLAIRAQYDGAVVNLSKTFLYDCIQFQEDHAIIDLANLESDIPKIVKKYSNPNWKESIKINIDYNNWKNKDSIWRRRFVKT